MKFLIEHFYIFLSIFFAVCSQLIIKWKMSSFSFNDTQGVIGKFLLAISMLVNPYIILSIIFTLFSGLSWMIAMTKFEISYAYPFTILGFIVVMIMSYFLFDEDLNIYKIIGTFIVIIGIIIVSKGYK